MARWWYADINGKRCVAGVALQEMWGVNRDAIVKMCGKGLPKEADGYYSLVDAHKWYMEYKGFTGSAATAKDEKLEADVKYRQLKIEQEEIKLGALRGEYISLPELEEQLKSKMIVLKKAMLSLGRHVAGEAAPYVDAVTARRIERQVEQIVKEALEVVAACEFYPEPTEDVPGSGDDTELAESVISDAEATGEPDSQ